MWPLWWWPQLLMQPLMCRSMSPMSCSSSRSSKRSLMAAAIGMRAGVGQRAQVAAGAGDHVGEQADVGRGEAGFARRQPQRAQLAFAHPGQQQVLVVRDAQFAAG